MAVLTNNSRHSKNGSRQIESESPTSHIHNDDITPKRPVVSKLPSRNNLLVNHVESATKMENNISRLENNLEMEEEDDIDGVLGLSGRDSSSERYIEDEGTPQAMECGPHEAGSRTRSSAEKRSNSVEPVVLSSNDTSTDRRDQIRSLTPSPHSTPASRESVPEAKRIRLTSPVHNCKQQQQTTTQLLLTNQKHSSSETSTPSRQATRQTSYTTSSIQFVNKSPVVTNTVSVHSNSSGTTPTKSQTSSSNTVRPVCLWANCMR